MQGVGDFDGDDAMTLSAVSEAMNQMMGGASTAVAAEFAIDIEVAPPTAAIVETAADLGDMPDGAFAVRFSLTGEGFAAEVVQIVPAEFANVLEKAMAAAATMHESEPAEAPVSAEDAATLDAVERAARITAESAASVLSVLVGDRADATMPEIEVRPDDPMARLAYPVITVEVGFVSGVTGSNLFVLTPEQAATLATLMIGMDAATGDGLSDIELSAVSEAMNQMMGATDEQDGRHCSAWTSRSRRHVVTILQTHEDAVPGGGRLGVRRALPPHVGPFHGGRRSGRDGGVRRAPRVAFAAADAGRDVVVAAAVAASPCGSRAGSRPARAQGRRPHHVARRARARFGRARAHAPARQPGREPARRERWSSSTAPPTIRSTFS